MSARRLVAVNWSFSAPKAEEFFERREPEEVRKVIQKEKSKFEIQFWFYFCIFFSALSA
jgi:hypothetical protein